MKINQVDNFIDNVDFDVKWYKYKDGNKHGQESGLSLEVDNWLEYRLDADSIDFYGDSLDKYTTFNEKGHQILAKIKEAHNPITYLICKIN